MIDLNPGSRHNIINGIKERQDIFLNFYLTILLLSTRYYQQVNS